MNSQSFDLFPSPPDYYKLLDSQQIKDESFQKLSLKDESKDKMEDGDKSESIPMKPPKIPSDDELYQMFGSNIAIIQREASLEDSNIKLLFNKTQEIENSDGLDQDLSTLSSSQKKLVLKELNRRLLEHYIELLDLIVKYPTATIPNSNKVSIFENEDSTNSDTPENSVISVKVQQIELIMLNMNYLLSQSRHHQILYQLSHILDVQKQRRQSATDNLVSAVNDVVDNVRQYQEKLQTSDILNDIAKSQNSATKRTFSETLLPSEDLINSSSIPNHPHPHTTNGSKIKRKPQFVRDIEIPEDVQQLWNELSR